MNRAIFFDRDGVINEIIIRENNYKSSPRTLEEFRVFEEAKILFSKLKNFPFLNFIFTNQPEVSRGLISLAELGKMHQLLKETLFIDDIIVCLHDNYHNCDCRKPKPGMILETAKKWSINLSKSFVVGDRNKDIEAGKSAGCKTILLETQYNINNEINPHFRIKSILEIPDIVRVNLD